MECANVVVIVKSEFPSIWWPVPFSKRMNTTQTLWHAFAVKGIIRQIVTSCFAPSHLSNAPRLHQFGRLNNELLQYKSDADSLYLPQVF